MSKLIPILILFLFIFISPVYATDKLLYKQTFVANPQWNTNNPSNDYWDTNISAYHFNIEPSTANQAYPYMINYNNGSFRFEYNVTISQLDEGATFRFGFAGNDIDRTIGPNIITEFTNDYKYGNIMRLHIVTQDSKLLEVSSIKESYGGYNTLNFNLNTPYHVTVTYDDETYTVIMRVADGYTNKELWKYYLDLHGKITGMKRLYIGSVGDYSIRQNIYATGYIDDIYFYSVIPNPPTTIPTVSTPIPTNTPYIATPLPTRIVTLYITPVPTTQSSLLPEISVIGLIIVGAIVIFKK